jgi:hypothetical protein
MKPNLLDDILSDFKTSSGPAISEELACSNITVRLPLAYKERYDRLQEQSGRRLSKKVRQMLIALLDAAEAKTS